MAQAKGLTKQQRDYARRVIEPFVQSRRLDNVARYAADGRRYATMETADLKAAWLEVLQKLPLNPTDPVLRLARDDFEAEFELRAEQPPSEDAAAKAAMKALDESVDAYTAHLRESDPGGWNQAAAQAFRDLSKFLVQKKHSN